MPPVMEHDDKKSCCWSKKYNKMDVELYTVALLQHVVLVGWISWWGEVQSTLWLQITIEKRFAWKVEGQRNFKNEFKDGHSQ